jgi:hypothetical protein
MSHIMLILTGLAYLVGCIDQAIKRDYGHSLMFLGYAMANVGLFLAIR